MSRLFICMNYDCCVYIFVVKSSEDKVSCPKCGKDHYLCELLTK